MISVFAAALIGVVAGGLITLRIVSPVAMQNLFSAGSLSSPLKGNTATSTNTVYISSDNYEQSVINAVAKVNPSVVSVVISKDVPNIEQCPYNPFAGLPSDLQNMFGSGTQFYTNCQKGTSLQQIGSGSGFIISSDGLIFTNKHVVEDTGASYTVFTNDGKQYAAKVVARDPLQDIAIIKINATGLPAVTLGDSSKLELGQTSIAIGNALGQFRNTVSVGSISGLYRTVTAGDQLTSSSETLNNVIQTTSAINPGNSGGPLLDLNGDVIGINTAVDVNAQNVGFAIPINAAKRDAASVEATGSIQIPYLGVRYLAVTPDVAKSNNLSVDYGALIQGDSSGNPAVESGSPAQKVGLQTGDVILSVDGVKVDTQNNTLSALIQSHSVGEVVTLEVQRGKTVLTVKVTLAQYPTS